ncbi:hypothetical protein JD969_10380 [Planctomycetota bacterium]|nr:hypothetical protein JD969_10380 [Planctomycetota bacterium]
MMQNRILGWLGIAGVILMSSDFANAQQQVNQSGQALDANQQVGTSGLNRPAFQEDFRLRNDIVTDNVPGLRGFRGAVGYTAPGVFGFTNEQTDPLFRFRAQSLASSPSRLDAVQIGSAGGGGEDYQNVSIYGTFTNIPAFRTGGKVLAVEQLKPGVGYQVIAPTRTAQGVRIETDEGIISYRPRASTIGVADLPQEGQSIELQASPLLGLRKYLRLTDPSFAPANPELNLGASDDENVPNLDSEYQVQGTVNSGVGTSGIFAEQPAQIAPGLRIGQQLQTQVTSSDDESQIERVARLENQLLNPLSDRQVKPGEDVYADLLNAVRQQGQQEQVGGIPQDNLAAPQKPEEEATQEGNAPQSQNPYILPGTQGTKTAFGTPQTNQTNQLNPLEQAMYDALNQPSDEEVELEEKKAEEQKRRLNIPSNMVYQPRAPRPSEEEYLKKLDDLMNQLDYELPRIETFVGTKNDAFNRDLKKAEDELASGRYFAAENAYRLAVRARPENPLARIGLVHAQLGAGLIRSSAHNLRLLFERDPQMIAARYNPKLLPSPQRLQWVQGELTNMIKQGQGGPDPGLMLAYLGYQIDSKSLIRYGLAVIEQFSPTDPLLPVLRRIWLDEKPEAAPANPAPAESGSSSQADVPMK